MLVAPYVYTGRDILASAFNAFCSGTHSPHIFTVSVSSSYLANVVCPSAVISVYKYSTVNMLAAPFS